MKNLHLSFAIAIALLSSCKSDEAKPNQDLYDQIAGEWTIVQMTFPANDSTVTIKGQAMFEACDVYHSGDCGGYFSLNSEIVNFRYQVNHFSDASNQIEMGPLEQDRDNMLGLQRGGYDIIILNKNNLTIDLTFCTYDADSKCVITHRHVAMTR